MQVRIQAFTTKQRITWYAVDLPENVEISTSKGDRFVADFLQRKLGREYDCASWVYDVSHRKVNEAGNQWQR